MLPIAILQRHSIPANALSPADLQRCIYQDVPIKQENGIESLSLELLSDKNQIASSYVFARRMALPTGPWLTYRDPQTEQPWDGTEPQVDPFAGHCGVGNIYQPQIHPPYLIFNSHFSPSTGCTVILKMGAELTLSDDFLSLYPISFSKDWMIYSGGMVHFAPTHQERLYAYQFEAKRRRLLYPNPPHSPLRKTFMLELQSDYARIPSAQANARNHHFDAEQMTQTIGDVRYSEALDLLVFNVQFENDASLELVQNNKSPTLALVVLIEGALLGKIRTHDLKQTDFARNFLHTLAQFDQAALDAGFVAKFIHAAK